MSLFVSDPDFTLYHGDVREVLRTLPDESVHCVVTSPPYWGLRDYGTGLWEGGEEGCDHTMPSRVDKAAAVATSTLVGSTDTQGHLQEPSYRDVCGKCGARRIDQQLGLDPTPDEYVANMVAVFREVRRVLRRDGTCWLNIGDSYASGGGAGNQGENGQMASRSVVNARASRPRGGLQGGVATVDVSLGGGRGPGLKPKDLVGIPWRLAFALQQPYYTGRIKDERDRIWLAAMVDAEGCIHIHRRKAGDKTHSIFTKADGTVSEYVRKNDTYGVMVTLDNTSKAIIERAHEIIGQGARYSDPANSGVQQRRQELYRLTLTGQQSRELLRELYPHLIAKQQQARIAYHSPSNGDEAARAHEAIKDLHNGRPTDVDAPAPPTLYEPGWYLRSDVIWGKPNPMPESVTDRPTKAHEFVFLLTRSPRYYFDQEAVREPHSPDGRKKTVHDHLTDRSHPNYDNVGNGNERWPNGGRNVRSVWEIATQPYAEAHFATFPEALVERCVKAGTSERGCCPECGAPWERETDVSYTNPGNRTTNGPRSVEARGDPMRGTVNSRGSRLERQTETTGWRSTCDHGHDPVPCVVLDPFMGSGTTALVARRLGRRSIGVELNADYCALAARRLQQLSLLATA